MPTTDPIADLLTRIRNANTALRTDVSMPYSRLKAEIAALLKREGYIADVYAEKQPNGQRVLQIELKIVGKERSIVGLRRISRPGRRRYVGAGEIPRVLSGMGTAIVTTSRGVMTGREARQAKVGGELLAYVW
ncbi:30S ribosomal protein S8 [bacterium]|nr:30S ribosomal protein S8 [bacterium]